MLLTSENTFEGLRSSFFSLFLALIATTPMVVWAQRASGLKVWLRTPVAKKVSPAEVLLYYKQSLLSVNHLQ